MELTRQEPRVVFQLNHFNQLTVFRTPTDNQTTFDQLLDIIVVHFIAMSVPFMHDAAAINSLGQATLIEPAGLFTQTHGSA